MSGRQLHGDAEFVGQKLIGQRADAPRRDHPARHIDNRYDFKGTSAKVEFNEKDKVITLHGDSDFQLDQIKQRVRPANTLLVIDAMIGQDAVTTAKSFDERIDVSGVVLTKLDGDARGGAALSMRAVTGAPIKLLGAGEKLDALEDFHPDRIAGMMACYERLFARLGLQRTEHGPLGVLDGALGVASEAEIDPGVGEIGPEADRGGEGLFGPRRVAGAVDQLVRVGVAVEELPFGRLAAGIGPRLNVR